LFFQIITPRKTIIIMDLLATIISGFGEPNTIDNRDILCYQRGVYEGLYNALECAERLGHATKKERAMIKLNIDKLNAQIGQLSREAFQKRSKA